MKEHGYARYEDLSKNPQLLDFILTVAEHAADAAETALEKRRIQHLRDIGMRSQHHRACRGEGTAMEKVASRHVGIPL